MKINSTKTILFPQRKWEWIIILTAVAIRLALAIVNRVANDAHHEVWTMLLLAYKEGGFPPGIWDCRECFHPKLYYAVCAWLSYVLNLENISYQIVVAQLVNVVCGTVTLLALMRYLRQLRLPSSVYLTTLAFLALNPRLVALNAQASNDTMAIMFATLATLALMRLLSEPGYSHGLLSSSWAALALLCKGNSLVTFCVLTGVTFFRLVLAQIVKMSRGILICTLISFVIWAVTIGMLLPEVISPYTRYFHKLTTTAGISAVQFTKAPSPNWFKRTYHDRPGVISIADSYFTFRFIDLIKNPVITNNKEPEPFHRTSLWTQLYGRFYYSYFDQWPWQRSGVMIDWLGRLIFIVALWPTSLLLIGLWRGVAEMVHRVKAREFKQIFATPEILVLLIGLGYLALIVIFTIEYRDFSAMKDIYMLPGIVAFLTWYVWGRSWALKLLGARTSFRFFDNAMHLSLIFLSLANSVLLFEQLYSELN